ncbi:hypothetical protein B0H15DRAFT_771246 [Mycena belliarum]|uniref:SET domain-containing protein n=1 Tax=Mycena belliarum TaxID=1033014 RepID=A0AAD6UFL2_9AGAR|nr:hypothetical protein B0H15DRAFT_771246 [Mycena belliae]
MVTEASQGVPQGYKPKLRFKNGVPDIHGPNLPEDQYLFTSIPHIPSDSPSIASKDGWTSAMLQVATQAKIPSTPGFPSPMARPPDVRHRIGPTSNMGLGVFSTARLQMGDLILSDRPLIVVPLHMYGSGDYPKNLTQKQTQQAVLADAELYLQFVLDRLDPENRKAYMALANSHLKDGSGPILGIMRTNGMGIDALIRPGNPPMPYSAVCKEISRLNHSCCPNTGAGFNMASFSYRLWALCDIAPGEELTLSYTDVTAPAAERQKALEPYGFQCTCRACQDPRTSDARRSTIFNEKLFLTPALLKTWTDEGLQASRIYDNRVMSLWHYHVYRGDADNALVCGQLLTKLWRWSNSDAEKYTDLALIRSHPMWMKLYG